MSLLLALLLTGCSALPPAQGQAAPPATNNQGATQSLPREADPTQPTSAQPASQQPDAITSGQSSANGAQEQSSQGGGLGSPLGSAGPETTAAGMIQLQQELQAYVESLDGIYGLHLIDLSTGLTASVNADQPFPTASTFKLPMAMYILRLAELGEAELEEQLEYLPEDYEEGTGLLQDEAIPGDTFSVSQLLELALTQSDNIATNMLLRRFGREQVFGYMRAIGGRVTQFADGRTATTPREMAGYLLRVYQGQAIADSRLLEMLLTELTHTAFHDRIEAGVPDDVPVAHKIGTLPGVVNDVGIVLLPERSFILAVFSADVGEAAAAEAIAEITHRIYQFEQDRP